MKRILITGANSYVGKSLTRWLAKYPEEYFVESLSVRDELWTNKDFSIYDVVFHAAGIAHVSSDPRMEELYYKVNRDLAIQIATKAKSDGVKQLIFMSSIIVYGDSRFGKKTIDWATPPSPSNFYGNSKLQAELGIMPLEVDNFRIAILRPPMIYGKGAKGNYSKLAKLARLLPVFPNIDNRRSMLHIDNLCEFIKLIVDNGERGLFFPQNKEYVKTSEMVQIIAETRGKKIFLTRVFNPLIKLLSNKMAFVNKVFGDLVYDKELSNYKTEYRIRDFRQTILMTEVEKS